MSKEAAKENGQKVTVIGLGSMGASIARAFITKGFEVTVWNRDHSKTLPFINEGATAEMDISNAISASQLIVICVADYKATNRILNAASPGTLRGRTLIQLSTGTPKEAREFDAWVKEQGGESLNGDILAWPGQIGTSDASISISGSVVSFHRSKGTLEVLAGTVDHTGEEPGASAVLFQAVMAYLAGNWIGFCHGALICENEGMHADVFGKLIADISPILAKESIHMGEVIRHGRYSDPESTINTTANDLHLLAQHSREAGISSELPEFAADLFQQAADAGYGKEEHAAIIKVMRKR